MNFNKVEVKEGFEQKYMSTGTQVVKFIEVGSGAASTGTGFVELTVENTAGLTCATRFYFAPGKNTEISAQALYDFIAVTNNVEKAKAKEMIGEFADYADLAKKLSALLIGKPFAMLVKGKYIPNKDVTYDSWIKAELSTIVTTKDKVDTLKFDSSKHISGDFIKGTGSTTSNVQGDVTKPVATSW